MTDVTDDFNRANGALGANWTAATTAGINSALSINTNGATSGTTAWGVAWWNANTFPSDHYAAVTYLHDFCAPVVRFDPATGNGYTFLNNGGLYRLDAGSFTLLTTLASASAGTVVRLEIVGSLLTARFNGVSQGTFTDTTYSGGSAGFACFNNGAAPQIDDWLGGPIVPSTLEFGATAGTLFQPGRRSGPTRGLRPTQAFPDPIVTQPQGIPPGTIFVPNKRYGPTRGLHPTQAFPRSPPALLIGAGTYAYSGAAVTLDAGIVVPAAAYVYSGTAVTLSVGINIVAGSYTYTGVNVTLTYTPAAGNNFTLAIGAGAYTETGAAVTLAVGIPVGAGSYAYTGATVGLGAGIGIAAGTYVYSGASINFALHRIVGSAAYNVTGFPVGLGAGINVGAGAYAVTGLPVTLGVGIGISAGAYAVTGSPVGLGAGINIGAGAYTVTGAAVRLDVGMGVSAGSYVYTGATVGLIYVPIGPHPYVLSIGAGAYVYNGVPVGLVYVPFGPPTGAFTVSGKDVACNYGVSGQGAKFGFSNPVNPFATVVLETDR